MKTYMKNKQNIYNIVITLSQNLTIQDSWSKKELITTLLHNLLQNHDIKENMCSMKQKYMVRTTHEN